MRFRSRTKNSPDVFGLNTGPGDQIVHEADENQVDDVMLGSEPQYSKWNSLRAPVARMRWRVGIFLILIIFGLLAARSGYLQVVRGDHYRVLADANRIRLKVIPAHRGVIKDRTGLELAENTPSFRLIARPQDLADWPSNLPDDESARSTLIRDAIEPQILSIAEKLAIPSEQVIDKLVTARIEEQLLITEDIDYEAALGFMTSASEYPGFILEFAEKRRYYTSAVPTLSHVLGYTGPVTSEEYETLESRGYRSFDSVGKLGLEAEYEDLLRGRFGEELVEVNAHGQPLRVVSRSAPINGQDLVLALDARLQAYIEIVLEERLRNQPTQRAVVVIMQPDSGEILALVSSPGFDANLFANGINPQAYTELLNDPNQPLFSRAQAGEYPAGSTIKPVFAAAALTNKTITTGTTFYSSGGVLLGNRFFPDWRPEGHGLTNVYHAIADSVNTFFYIIGGGNESFPGMGLEKLMTAALSFGYGLKTGVDLPGEANGFLPSKKWKEEAKGEPWYIGDTYNVAIGQGDFLVTPLQVARATAVFANGGYLVTPHLIIGDDQPTNRILDEEVVNIVREGMRQTVTSGSAQSLQNVPVTVAGKTGTAQWSSEYAPHSWFTGFAPFNEPEVVLTILVEQGGDDSIAVPIANDILTWIFSDR